MDTAAPVSFLATPLAVWVQTFSSKNVSYRELFDGVYLNNVMLEIDSKCTKEGLTTHIEDTRDRVQNWDILMKNIKAYYKEVLQQMIVMRLPNIVTISKDPESDVARSELTRVLLLILGCAMQCEQKENYIENIKSLDYEIQHAIVEYIKEITDDSKNVYSIELPPEDLDDVSRNIFSHLHGLLHERDGYIEEIKDLNATLEELYRAQQAAQQELQAHKAASSGLSPSSGPAGLGQSPGGGPNTPEKHHLELAETKAKLRKIRQELEDKTEISNDLQEELDELKANSSKLRAENIELLQDARAARTYRDELDILKEKASRVEKYELEIGRYKEKLNELEFYKARTEELREDNQVLVETKALLEDQLSASHKRVEAVLHLEDELSKYKQQFETITQERDVDREKMQQLVEKNARLEFEKKSSFNENANLEEELVKARRQLNVGLSKSLSEQFSASSNASVLRMELENQRLREQLEELQQTAALDSSSKLLELQKENLRLSTKVEALQQASSKEVESCLDMEQKVLGLTRDNQQLEQTLETVRENADRQVSELERDNEALSHSVETLRRRTEQTRDTRVQDTERENKRLHDNVKVYTAKVSQLELENKQLKRSSERLEDSVVKLQQLEEEMLKAEHEKEDLRKEVATLELTCETYEKLEQESADVKFENERMVKTVDNLQATIAKLKVMEQDNINLTVDAQHLRRTIELMKNSSSQVVDLEQEKHELSEHIHQLERTLETYKLENSKQDQLEGNIYELDTENQKLQRSLEAVSRKYEALQKDHTDLDANYSKVQKAYENSKMALRRVDELEKEIVHIEQENSELLKSKSTLDKENKRTKVSLEAKAASVDELSNRIMTLERQNKSLERYAERNEELAERVTEADQENMEIVRQSGMDKKALAVLREELVNEKLKTQQLHNDMEKTNQELQKMGLNRERLLAATNEEGESKYRALESMMADTYRKAMEIKEDQIQALESRLDESKSVNVQIQGQMKSVRRQYEALQQRREEESLQYSSSPHYREKSPPSQVIHMASNNTKDILELKDHIIAVERNNATLEAEVRSHKLHASTIQQQLEKSDRESSQLLKQISTLQSQNGSIQSQLAKVQVDNTTVQSQNSSLMSQNSSLQRDCSKLETERDRLLNDNEEILASRQELVLDHEALQQIHDQLSKEYDALISEHGSLKANYKSLKGVYDELVDENAAMAREKLAVSQLKQMIEEDQKNMKTDNAKLSQMHMEYLKLKEEHVGLQNNIGKMSRQYNDLMSDHKSVKQENNSLKSKHSELQELYARSKERLAAVNMEVDKLANKCETVSALNIRLEEENRDLMLQVKGLLTQNQDILMSSLETKDQQAEEQKQYLETFADLRRQKEKLEEKIMEQYKRYDPVKKKNRFGANLVKRAKQMVSRSKSKDRTKATMGSGDFAVMHDSGENSSLGSGSVGENHDQLDRGRPARRKGGRYSRNDTQSLTAQNKALAKSTTALNALYNENQMSGNLRGARSTENLLDSHRRSDGESMSSSSDLRNPPEWSNRPSRRRPLKESLSTATLNTSDLAGRHGSLSSEDTPGSRGLTRHDLSLTPKSARSTRDAVTQDDDDDDEDDDEGDGLISLTEFLSEVNKSPTSRRKYIQKSFIEGKSAGDEAETSVLSPQLGARSPLIEVDETSPTKVRARNWKSEMNISQLTRTSSSGSAFRTFDRRQLPNSGSLTPMKAIGSIQEMTSTPNSSGRVNSDVNSSYSSDRASFNNRLHEDDTPNKSVATRLFDPAASNSSFQSPNNYEHQRNSDSRYNYNNGQLENHSNGSFSRDNQHRFSSPGQQPTQTPPNNMRSVSSLGIPYQTSPPEYHERERSKTPSMMRNTSGSSIGSANIGAYNAMTRQTSAGSQRPDGRPDHDSQRSLPRPPTTPVPHNNNNKYSDASDQNYHPGSGQRSLPRPPESSGYPAPVRPQHHDNYNPDNVRNLVQDYQYKQQQTSPPTNTPPALPQRRSSRPKSATPGRSSANYSLPQRSYTPGVDRPQTPQHHQIVRPQPTLPAGSHSNHPNSNHSNHPNSNHSNQYPNSSHPSGNPLNSNHPSGGRLLPATPQDSGNGPTNQGQRPQSGPPNGGGGGGGGEGGDPASKVWYTYGCV